MAAQAAEAAVGLKDFAMAGYNGAAETEKNEKKALSQEVVIYRTTRRRSQ